MKKLKLLLAAVAMLGALMGAPQAADTSVTVNIRRSITPVGVSPQVGYVKATITAATAGATFELPAPRGSANIAGFLPVARNVSGSTKPLNITVSGSTVTVSGSNMTSGSMAVSDTVEGVVFYKP